MKHTVQLDTVRRDQIGNRIDRRKALAVVATAPVAIAAFALGEPGQTGVASARPGQVCTRTRPGRLANANR